MSIFTSHLKEEHKLILRILDLFDAAKNELQKGMEINASDLDMLAFALQRLVEGSHHIKEEELLFPALLNSGKLPKGGPRCTYFMGQKLQDNIAERILTLAGPDYQAHATQQRKARHREVDLTQRSPLEIPLEEHDASHYALMRIRLELAEYEPSLRRAPMLIARLNDYVTLMRQHIEKEDTCLFEVADRVLDEATQVALYEQAMKLVPGIGNRDFQWIETCIWSAGQSLKRPVA